MTITSLFRFLFICVFLDSSGDWNSLCFVENLLSVGDNNLDFESIGCVVIHQ